MAEAELQGNSSWSTGDSASELQGKYGGGALEASARQSGALAAFLGMPGLAVVAFASVAWLRRRRRAAVESDVDPPWSARPMIQAEGSELDIA